MGYEAVPILIFLPPFIAALLVPAFYRFKGLCQPISLVSLALSLIFGIIGLNYVLKGDRVINHASGDWFPPVGIQWHLDSLSAVICILVSLVALVVLFATRSTLHHEVKQGTIPFYSTVLLNISGLFGILLTHDLFNLFVFLEVSSLTTYALIATGDRHRGNLASLRYLLLGTIGASFYLLGVGYLYGVTGTLNLSDMADRLPAVFDLKSTQLGLLLIFIGLAIKMGLFPFHGWLPDSYTYASNPASALIAPLATKVSIYVFIRIFYGLLGPSGISAIGLDYILLALGAIAIVYGSIKAFLQKEFKRMLAFSSISHIGLIIIGIGVNEIIALTGAILHIVHHAIMKASLFLIAAAAYEKHGITNIFDFKKLRNTMPYTKVAIIISALSMIGIPPLCGFFSKWYILVGAFKAGYTWVPLVIIFSSLLTALYFFKLIEIIFFNGESSKDENKEGAWPLVLSYGLLSIGLFVLGYFAPTLFNWGTSAFAVVMK